MSELKKRCPFCGAKADLRIDDFRRYTVEAAHLDTCPLFLAAFYPQQCKQDAIDNWDNRVESEDVRI